MKQCLFKNIKIIHLKKGETYKFKNFPGLGLFIMAEGRLEVKWFNLIDSENAEDHCVKETLYVRDYLDSERLNRLYPNQGIINNTGICISQKAIIFEIESNIYDKHYRMSEKFNKNNLS